MSLPAEIERYANGLTLTGGDHDGQPVVILPWERRLLRGAFGRPGNAAVSVARGNGKSAIVAAIATAVVDPGAPLHGRRREVVCVASSFQQGRIIFEDCLAFLTERHGKLDRQAWRIQDSANNALCEHRASGARIRCLGSDPARAHGLRPALALLDEPAQWEAAKSERMLAAIRTGLGKVPGSKLIALGTRPVGEDHWFARMLGGEGTTYAQIHAAPDDAPPFQRRTWLRANPSLNHLPSLEATIREEAADAKRDPAMMAAFRALRLNQGTSDTIQQMLLDAGVWERIEGEAEQSGPSLWGVDPGGSAAQSAVASYWLDTGALDALAVFPAEPSLQERGLADGVGRLYVDQARRGELVIAGERVSDLGEMLNEARRRWGVPEAVVSDAWRYDELRQVMGAINLRVKLIQRRQGFLDGGQDVREFRRACLGGRVTPTKSLLMRSAMSEARCLVDPAGNAKLSKGTQGGRRLRARDDAAAACIIGVAEGARRGARPRNDGPQVIAVIR